MIDYSRGALFEAVDDGTGGGGNSAAFDPAAFQASLLGEVNKTLTGFMKTLKTDIGKITSAAPSATVTDPDPAKDDAQPGDGKTSTDSVLAAQLKTLERQNRVLQEQFQSIQKQAEATKAEAETKERHSAIRDALANFSFGSDAQRDTAFRIFRDEIKRTADGLLVGGADEAPLKEYITDQMKQHAYLLSTKDVASAGARSGRPQAAGKNIDLNSIKPGMSAAELAAATAAISAALNN
jgi:uncharacterized coiled-coil protein SlyX